MEINVCEIGEGILYHFTPWVKGNKNQFDSRVAGKTQRLNLINSSSYTHYNVLKFNPKTPKTMKTQETTSLRFVVNGVVYTSRADALEAQAALRD